MCHPEHELSYSNPDRSPGGLGAAAAPKGTWRGCSVVGPPRNRNNWLSGDLARLGIDQPVLLETQELIKSGALMIRPEAARWT